MLSTFFISAENAADNTEYLCYCSQPVLPWIITALRSLLIASRWTGVPFHLRSADPGNAIHGFHQLAHLIFHTLTCRRLICVLQQSDLVLMLTEKDFPSRSRLLHTDPPIMLSAYLIQPLRNQMLLKKLSQFFPSHPFVSVKWHSPWATLLLSYFFEEYINSSSGL